ncbi:hypothetical protein Pint_27285 [Pistacia integerrima]|uniref:Uncharacterized protein n=1 Tax=Pistacia integerrima TaxID=434235 RepID=A0ACC0YQ51_9ROSI|nr:hypothetical protein Pint_27285 [Pistacia integerrima]
MVAKLFATSFTLMIVLPLPLNMESEASQLCCS